MSSWSDTRDHSKEMFKTASKMKVDLQLNIEDYEAIMYPPGALFDEKTMGTDRSDRIQGKSAHCRQILLIG